ncbi:hypothetical protein [Nocardia sp. NPDC056100]|uniref:hypothetical protein n=1 Tax=Nocardia sp. NPDC056100 TaxID=3345712 RepID=UPI0035D5B771
MASGNEPNEDPTTKGPDPDWWQGAPAADSPWQSHPAQPQQPAPNYGVGQSDPTVHQPWGQQPPPTAPFTGGQPYQSAPNPYQSAPSQPYQQAPYQSGPSPYQQPPPQPPYGPPGYGQQPPGGGKGKGWLFAGIGALVLVIIGAVVTVVLVNRGSNDPSAHGNTTPSLISALTTTPSGNKPSTSPKPTSAPKTSTPAPVIPGYQVVTITENGAAYDIPKDWKLDRTGQTSFNSGGDSVPIAGLAQDGVDYCPNYVRTNVFLSQSTETDPAKAAADISTRMAKIGWSTSTGSTPGASEPFSNTDNQLQGVYLETKGNAPPPASGCASTYSIYTFAFPGDNGAFVFTIAADTGVANSVDATLAKKILATIRPL